MFTKNFNVVLPSALRNTNKNVKIPEAVGYDGVKISEYTKTLYNHYLPYYHPLQYMTTILSKVNSTTTNNGSATNGVIFGTGNTAPTANDYCLSGEIITGLDSNNVTFELSDTAGEDDYTLTCVYTISNTTGADITIGEVGVVSYAVGYDSSTSNSYYNSWYFTTLLERTALETTITIPAGEIGRVTYSITIKDPIA